MKPPVPVLVLVSSERVPVEQLRGGDRLVLPTGQRVTVECVDEFDDGYVVRWWRPTTPGEPGHSRANGGDGRYLGSLVTVPRGHCWTVDRGE